MKSDDLLKKLGNLTLDQVIACIFQSNIHVEPKTQLWNKRVEDIIRNMKY
jgi:hypothetical protein